MASSQRLPVEIVDERGFSSNSQTSSPPSMLPYRSSTIRKGLISFLSQFACAQPNTPTKHSILSTDIPAPNLPPRPSHIILCTKWDSCKGFILLGWVYLARMAFRRKKNREPQKNMNRSFGGRFLTGRSTRGACGGSRAALGAGRAGSFTLLQ